MREIKFKAWDKKNKCFPVALCLEDFWHDVEKDPERYVVVQFTGLKDKNGKEIYCSDYLKQEGLEVEVKWSDFDAGFVFEDESGSHMSVTSGNSDQWEVIGNQFENPELLKEVLKEKHGKKGGK